MKDPSPENISGSKIQKHTFEHQIRWDLLVGAVVVGFVAWKVFGGISSSEDEENEKFSEQIEQLSGDAARIDVA